MKSTILGVMTPVTVHELVDTQGLCLDIRCLTTLKGQDQWSKELLQFLEKYKSNTYRYDSKSIAASQGRYPSQLSTFDVNMIQCEYLRYKISYRLFETLHYHRTNWSAGKWQLHFIFSVLAPDGVEVYVKEILMISFDHVQAFIKENASKLDSFLLDPYLLYPPT